eukprot:Rhum_TRINITY_DN14856_c1_g2::Rhum_TRINITY_DN14856_c1_g2_i2::g.124194::m.124194
MKTVLCLLAALAGTDATIVTSTTCGNWKGRCVRSKVKDTATECVERPTKVEQLKERSGETLALPTCNDATCCRYPTCAEQVTCPTGYTTSTDSCSLIPLDASRESTTLAAVKVLSRCTEQLCCSSTCGARVTCPAKKDSKTNKAVVCAPQPTPRSRDAHVLAVYCTEASCCKDTCASAFTECPADQDTTTAAATLCVPRSIEEGRAADALVATCNTALCCRPTCKSNSWACPAGTVPGKHELRPCSNVINRARPASVLKVEIAPLDPCSNDHCCETVHTCAAAFDCPVNTKQKADMADVKCIGTACVVADCCVDVPVTCAAAESKCTGNSTLKVTPGTIACGLSAIAPAANACTLDKCCNYAKDVPCANDAACRTNADSAAKCVNGECKCTAKFTIPARDANNVRTQSCVSNRLFFALTFTDGDYSKLAIEHRNAASAALSKRLKLRKLKFSQGSILVSGEADGVVGSVKVDDIVADLKAAIPSSVLGTKVQTTLNNVDNTCNSTVAGAVTAVKAMFASGEECVPTECNVATGYEVQPVAHKCVMRTVVDEDDDLTTGQKVGIALGVIAFVAIVVGIAVLVVLKGRSS